MVSNGVRPVNINEKFHNQMMQHHSSTGCEQLQIAERIVVEYERQINRWVRNRVLRPMNGFQFGLRFAKKEAQTRVQSSNRFACYRRIDPATLDPRVIHFSREPARFACIRDDIDGV